MFEGTQWIGFIATALVITQATDTFVVRNGRILVQTFAAYPAR